MYEQEHTNRGSQAAASGQVPAPAPAPAPGLAPGLGSAQPSAQAHAPMPAPLSAPPQAGGVRALHAWIVIILLALTLVVSSVGLVLQVMPVGMRGGANGANFVPNQSFPGGQSQDFEAPDGTTSSQGGLSQGPQGTQGSQGSQGQQGRIS